MGFSNPIRAVSELTADILTGAIVRTAATGQYIRLAALSVGLPSLDFLTGNPSELNPGSITGYDAGSGIGVVQVLSPSLGAGQFEALFMGPFTGWAHGLLRLFGGVESLFDGFKWPNGRQIKAIDCGDTGGTTDASSQMTINHTLGVVPDVILVSDLAANHPHRAYVPAAGGRTSSSFALTYRNSGTDALTPAGTSVRATWVVLAFS